MLISSLKPCDYGEWFSIASNNGGEFDCKKWFGKCEFRNLNDLNKCKCSKSLLNDNQENYLYDVYEKPSKSSNGIDKRALIGIIVAVVVVIIILVFFLSIKKRKRDESSVEEV